MVVVVDRAEAMLDAQTSTGSQLTDVEGREGRACRCLRPVEIMMGHLGHEVSRNCALEGHLRSVHFSAVPHTERRVTAELADAEELDWR